jgi:hypothetical protein
MCKQADDDEETVLADNSEMTHKHKAVVQSMVCASALYHHCVRGCLSQFTSVIWFVCERATGRLRRITEKVWIWRCTCRYG